MEIFIGLLVLSAIGLCAFSVWCWWKRYDTIKARRQYGYSRYDGLLLLGCVPIWLVIAAAVILLAGGIGFGILHGATPTPEDTF